MANPKSAVLLTAFLLSCTNDREEPPEIYVGIAKQTFIAVVVKADCANAYVTDGREGWVSSGNWLEARPSNGPLAFEEQGMSLSVSLESLSGTLTLPSSANDFTIELVDEPAGVYIGGATVDGVEYAGGWIFSAAGEQRGSVIAGGTLLPSLLMEPTQDRIWLENGVTLDVARMTEPYCKIPVGTTGGGVTSAGSGGGDGGDGGDGGGFCCKTCGANSKPCGDSCIALENMCHQPVGCACEG